MIVGVVANLITVGEHLMHQRFVSGHMTTLLEECRAGINAVEGFQDRGRLG